jgi:hypothetical protein
MAKLILRAEFIQSVGKAYERNTQTNEWYFEVFSAVDGEGTDLRNRLAEVLLPKSKIPLKGDVLVVKNGPENGKLETRVYYRGFGWNVVVVSQEWKRRQ